MMNCAFINNKYAELELKYFATKQHYADDIPCWGNSFWGLNSFPAPTQRKLLISCLQSSCRFHSLDAITSGINCSMLAVGKAGGWGGYLLGKGKF